MRMSKRQYECRNSAVFFTDETLYYVKNTGYLVEVSNKTDAGFVHALKLHISKRKIDIFETIKSEKMLCGFCNAHNSTWYPIYTVNSDREIEITGVQYKKPIRFCYAGYTHICDGKKLNPNSAEFVKTTRNLPTDNTALSFIRSRNKSPFYAENHESAEAYSKYQSSLFYGRDTDAVRSSILRIQLTKMKNYDEYVGKKKKTAYSFITETEHGQLLNSNGERAFYESLKTAGIEHFVLTNGFYENSIYMYDFYFPIIGLYVEIAGMDNDLYNSRIAEKQKTFNSLILYPRKDAKKFKQVADSIKEKILCSQQNTN